MNIQTVGQWGVPSALLAFETPKTSPNSFSDLGIGYEKSMLMSSLLFSCSGPYDPPTYPDYADPDSHP